ncbi:MAG: response regulator [Kofleriaceae bacterium]
MALFVLHTGQTGVERGADRAARAVGMRVEGFCTFERRDELGAVPPEIVADLIACEQRGARSALRATLEHANVVVIAVPDAAQANANTGIEALRRAARARGVPHFVVDSATDLDELGLHLRGLEQLTDPLRVMVTGPRFTRWRDGERLGWRVVAQVSLTTPAAAPRKHRVLVIDDHVDTAETECKLLRALGHEAIAATTGRQGIELAATFDPDIGLFAIGLPDLSGYEVARALRRTQARPLYLAAITGGDQARDANSAFAAGFDRHVIKPATAEILRGILDEAATRLPLAATS